MRSLLSETSPGSLLLTTCKLTSRFSTISLLPDFPTSPPRACGCTSALVVLGLLTPEHDLLPLGTIFPLLLDACPAKSCLPSSCATSTYCSAPSVQLAVFHRKRFLIALTTPFLILWYVCFFLPTLAPDCLLLCNIYG